MTVKEFLEKAKEVYDANVRKWDNWDNGYEYIGIRFEDKLREVGEGCENSRHNADREDERDFPEYGTAEYLEMEELDGTSAWNLEHYTLPSYWNEDADCLRYFTSEHCYIVASNDCGRHDDPDHNEILIKNAVVIAKLF